jgi:hypothetical protein
MLSYYTLQLGQLCSNTRAVEYNKELQNTHSKKFLGKTKDNENKKETRGNLNTDTYRDSYH